VVIAGQIGGVVRVLVGAGLAALIGLGGVGSPASASPATVVVDGHYRIVSTDCYFGAGKCSKVFDIEDVAGRLSSPTDRYFHGHIRSGGRVAFGEIWPPGVSEDGWWCMGTTTNGGLTVKGTMTDGIGGSGTFVLRRISD
jgi:hypothetical protein